MYRPTSFQCIKRWTARTINVHLELFSNLPQKMTPSQEFYQGLVCGILLGLFILWPETKKSRDRNNHQDQNGRKRGPEENDDYWSWKGKFEVKSMQLCSLCKEIAQIKNFRETGLDTVKVFNKAYVADRVWESPKIKIWVEQNKINPRTLQALRGRWGSGSQVSFEHQQGPVSRKFRELFASGKQFVKLQPADSVKLVLSYVVKGTKIKIAVKFLGSRRLRFEDTKIIMSPEVRPKSFVTFEKRAPDWLHRKLHAQNMKHARELIKDQSPVNVAWRWARYVYTLWRPETLKRLSLPGYIANSDHGTKW